MKKLFFTFLLALTTTAMYSQYYYVPYKKAGMNPGNINQEGENPFPNQPTGWNVIWSGDAGSSVSYTPVQNIPFSFNFNGVPVTEYKVSNAGFVTFSTAATANLTSFTNATLPNANVPDNSVAILGIKPISSVSGSNTYKSAIMTKTIGTAPNRQHWVQFNYFGEANISNGWTYWGVVLEESTNNVYIVDMKTLCVTGTTICTNNVKLSAGIQLDATTAEVVLGSPNLGANQIAANIFTSEDNSYYAFYPGSRKQYDLAAINIDVPTIILMKDAPFTIKGDFMNWGAVGVNTFEFAYQINSETPKIATINAFGLPTHSNFAFSHPTTWTPTAVGDYTITIWPVSINGEADEQTSNDRKTLKVFVGDKTAPRVSLHEVFTSSTCGPCTPGNRNTDVNIFPNRPGKVAVIKYQQDFPSTGDPYTTNESFNRRVYYGVNSIPRMQVDGGWDGNAQIYTLNLFDQFQSKPAFMEIKATHVVNFKTVTVNVDVTPYVTYSNPNMRLFVAINEKRTENNVKTNGETEFFHVLKKMIPNETGSPISGLVANQTKNVNNLSYEFKGDYKLPSNGQAINRVNLATEHSVENFENLEVVVFIQDIVTKEVFQSAVSSGTKTSIDNQQTTDASFSIYPNPTQGNATLEFSIENANQLNISMFNALGQMVKTIDNRRFEQGTHTIGFDTKELPKGVYFVRITGGNFSSTKNVVVN